MKTQKFATSLGEGTLVTLGDGHGAEVTLSTLGAGITRLLVPDAAGRLDDVVIGYASPELYLYDGPNAGKIAGRFANRIARGHFSIPGQGSYSLAVNCGPNHLHGGPTGFQNRIWEITEQSPRAVAMRYVSAHGEEGYPGQLTVRVRYCWDAPGRLRLDMEAEVEGAATVVNLTNHAYFNLDGHNAGSVLDHVLSLESDEYLSTDDTLVPLHGSTGEPVEGTPMDFRTPKTLGRDIYMDFPALKYGKGYDNCWVLRGPAGTLRSAARLSSPRSGRAMEIWTTQPAVQVYTGNWLTGSPVGKDGADYQDYDAVAIECQAYPDAPNRPDFPSTLLRPGERYAHTIELRFTAGK